jgi:hypothetical protein
MHEEDWMGVDKIRTAPRKAPKLRVVGVKDRGINRYIPPKEEIIQRRLAIKGLFYEGYSVPEMMARLGIADDKTIYNDLCRMGLSIRERDNECG